MAITRRQFLKRGALATAGVAAGRYMQLIPGTNVSYASGPSANGKIVVVVQLNGGNDGLGTVYPVGGPSSQRTDYVSIRPTLKEPDSDGEVAARYSSTFSDATEVLSLGNDPSGDEYAFHPAMTRFHSIFDSGQLAICSGVHYPHSDHSHFRSEEIWYTGDPLGVGAQGWFGKFLDKQGFGPNEVPVLIVDNQLNPVFLPSTASVFAVTRLNNLVYPASGNSSERAAKQAAVEALLADAATLDPNVVPELVKIAQTGDATLAKMAEYYTGKGFVNEGNTAKVEPLLLNNNGNYSRGNNLRYDSPLNHEEGVTDMSFGLARDLRHVAAAIRADVGACYFHVDIGGFDSHSNQEKGLFHSKLLRQISEAVGAFYQDMNQAVSIDTTGGLNPANYRTGNLANDVVIVTFSEFGRTKAQNAAGANEAGTDHAASAPQMVLGGAVQGGIYGAYPRIDDPPVGRQNDLKYVDDIRDFYGTILDRWLGIPAGQIASGNLGDIFPLTLTADENGRDYTGYTAIPFLL